MARQQIDFQNLSVAELVEMRDQLDGALEQKVAQERDDLQARLDALSVFQPRTQPSSNRRGNGRVAKRANGTNGGSKQHPLKGRKVAAKYRGPNGETWSGRGLAPRWMAALEAKGKKRDSFLVEAQ